MKVQLILFVVPFIIVALASANESAGLRGQTPVAPPHKTTLLVQIELAPNVTVNMLGDDDTGAVIIKATADDDKGKKALKEAIADVKKEGADSDPVSFFKSLA